MLARLEGFYIRAVYRMVHQHKPVWTTGGWEYPASEDLLKEAGLHRMEHYIQVCCDTIASYIMHRPIFNVCWGRGRRRGSRPRQFWWDQPMKLDGVRDTVEAKLDFGGGKARPL